MASPIEVMAGSIGSIDMNDMGNSRDMIPASFSLFPRTGCNPLINVITPASPHDKSTTEEAKPTSPIPLLAFSWTSEVQYHVHQNR